MDKGPGTDRAVAAAARACWLARVSESLDEAHRLVGRLAACSGRSAEAIALRARIMAVRAEVEALQRGRPAGFDARPLARRFEAQAGFDSAARGSMAHRSKQAGVSP